MKKINIYNWGKVLLSIGIDPRKLYSLRHLKRYFDEASRFRAKGGKINHLYPIFSDYSDQAGSARGHYFHQDLHVASLIFRDAPVRHIDVGSRIDGFVSHVASFREIEVCDVRDLHDTGHENIKFIKLDLMDESLVTDSLADSISCLHALEHFGLGRYGDKIDPMGHIKGLKNLVRMLKNNGCLYLGVPIGIKDDVFFNAHRVFSPETFSGWCNDLSLKLMRFDYVDDQGALHKNYDYSAGWPNVHYGCGIFTFNKIDSSVNLVKNRN